MTEPVVSIHADGKLAYVGYLSRAAERQGMRPNDLLAAIHGGHNLRQPTLWKTDEKGAHVRVPPARKYLGRVINN